MDRARQSVREAGFVFIAQRLQVSAPQVAGLKNQRLRQSACVCGQKMYLTGDKTLSTLGTNVTKS